MEIINYLQSFINENVGALIGLLGVGFSIYSSRKINEKSLEFQKQTTEHNEKYDLWRKKYDTLIQLIASCNDVGNYEFMTALNGVPATFLNLLKY